MDPVQLALVRAVSVSRAHQNRLFTQRLILRAMATRVESPRGGGRSRLHFFTAFCTGIARPANLVLPVYFAMQMRQLLDGMGHYSESSRRVRPRPQHSPAKYNWTPLRVQPP